VSAAMKKRKNRKEAGVPKGIARVAEPSPNLSREVTGEGSEGGTASRARKKSRAVQGPSPSSSRLQGEGKIGEETEGRAKRVPIEPVPYGSWKIKRLPPDLKEQLDKMLSEGTMHSCRQLSKWLGGNGFQISHAAIHKYGQKFEHKLAAIRLATEQARIVCEEFKNDDSTIPSALLRLVQTQLFNVLCVSHGKESTGAIDGPVAPVNLGALARSVSGLVKAETEHRKWVEQMRVGVAAAEKKVEEARAKGLSKAAAAEIKAVLMEI
jgi:Bacteriophage Mu, Gp27